jgi:hypothetical protein
MQMTVSMSVKCDAKYSKKHAEFSLERTSRGDVVIFLNEIEMARFDADEGCLILSKELPLIKELKDCGFNIEINNNHDEILVVY